ncbi:hypothetical protein AAFF_G00085510 [Aldrovandia affinis]|uniref:Uncharacterized protein n=1 Tax=Aldrovandia affinis TaxID=143900 RepID=A0AAD7RWQ4_9TELE|nr:hypothetical protein AAFF_G00085510 [Aldrovandia affinis]
MGARYGGWIYDEEFEQQQQPTQVVPPSTEWSCPRTAARISQICDVANLPRRRSSLRCTSPAAPCIDHDQQTRDQRFILDRRLRQVARGESAVLGREQRLDVLVSAVTTLS